MERRARGFSFTLFLGSEVGIFYANLPKLLQRSHIRHTTLVETVSRFLVLARCRAQQRPRQRAPPCAQLTVSGEKMSPRTRSSRAVHAPLNFPLRATPYLASAGT